MSREQAIAHFWAKNWPDALISAAVTTRYIYSMAGTD
jgi:hypothetical protein